MDNIGKFDTSVSLWKPENNVFFSLFNFSQQAWYWHGYTVVHFFYQIDLVLKRPVLNKVLWKSIHLIISTFDSHVTLDCIKRGRLKGAFEQLQLLPNKRYIKYSFSCKTSKDLWVKLTANYYTFFITV